METPSIYVGTYKKYNEGSLFGKWIDLDDFSDNDDFIEACLELHKDEDDPELMFQDWENIPDQFISESSLDSKFYDWLDTISSSHLDSEVFEAASDLDIPVESVEDAYQGQYKDDEDFAYQMADDCGSIDHDAGWPMNCIDWERAARDLMYDYNESGGHYFSSNY